MPRPTSRISYDPLTRHWYVPDRDGSYCLACGLPERNRHHAPRPT